MESAEKHIKRIRIKKKNDNRIIRCCVYDAVSEKCDREYDEKQIVWTIELQVLEWP